MDDETKALRKEIADLKDSVIVWKRSAEDNQRRAIAAEEKLQEYQAAMKDQAIERDLNT